MQIRDNIIQMRREIARTTRTIGSDHQLVEIIPRNNHINPPRQDHSLERRSNSLRKSQVLAIRDHSLQSQDTPIRYIEASSYTETTVRINEVPVTEKITSSSQYSIHHVIGEQQIISDNTGHTEHQHETLRREQYLQNPSENDIKFSRMSQDSAKSSRGHLESYYTRIKAIEERVQYYEAESRANQVYSNCLLEISKCLSSEEMPRERLKERITGLMEECRGYKEQIEKLDEACRTKEHNTNEELQKIIMDFNETVFLKNELELKIFDLTTENNSLRAQVVERDRDTRELQQRLNDNQMSVSRYHKDPNNTQQQLRLSHEATERQNQHLKQLLQTSDSKLHSHQALEFNYRQEIQRLSNFILELKTKWNVEFEHNKALEQERKNHLTEIARLSEETYRLDRVIQEARTHQHKIRMESETNAEARREAEIQLSRVSEELKEYRSANVNLSVAKEQLEHELGILQMDSRRLEDGLECMRAEGEKKSRAHEGQLELLKQQISRMTFELQQSQGNVMSKEEEKRRLQEEKRSLNEELSREHFNAMEQVKNQSHLEIEQERRQNRLLIDESRALQAQLQSISKRMLDLEGQLSAKKLYIFQVENSYKMKTVDLEEGLKRIDATFSAERDQLQHHKITLEGQLAGANQHITELQNLVRRSKQAQVHETQYLALDISSLKSKVQEYQALIHTNRIKLAAMEGMQEQKNKYQSDCSSLSKELHERAAEREVFIRKLNQEEALRTQSYEAQIASLKGSISQGEERLRSIIFDYDQQIKDMARKCRDLEQNLLMHTIHQEKEGRGERELRALIEELRHQYNYQLDSIRQQLLEDNRYINEEPQREFKNLLLQYDQKLRNATDVIERATGDDGILFGESRSRGNPHGEIQAIREIYLEEASRTRRDMFELMEAQKINGRASTLRVNELEEKVKTYQQTLHSLQLQNNYKNNLFQMETRSRKEMEDLIRDNEGLRQASFRLKDIIARNEETMSLMKTEISSWATRHDKLRYESQQNEDSLNRQIRSLKQTIGEMDKQNAQILTNDRTLDRLTSMPDLNRSTHNANLHNKSLITETNKNTSNPSLLVVENRMFDTGDIDLPRRLKSISHQIIERTVSPGTQVVVNVMQKPQDEHMQMMLQPEATLRAGPKINRALSPIGDNSATGMIPLRLNQESMSPTHRMCFASHRKSVSPPLVMAKEVEVVRQQKSFMNRTLTKEQNHNTSLLHTSADKTIHSPQFTKPQKPSGPLSNIPSLVTKPQTSVPLLRGSTSNISMNPKPSSSKERKLNITLVHNNSLLQKTVERVVENARSPGAPGRSPPQKKYCC